MAKKFVMVFNDYEVADAESAIVYADSSWVLRAFGRVSRFGVVFPLAVLGLALTWRRWRDLWVFHALIASMVCAVAAFYVMARYRYPIVPLLIPFAAAGLVEGVRRVRMGRGSTLRWGCVVAVAACVLCWWPMFDRDRLDAMAWMNAGVAHAQIGEIEPATRYFRFAVEGNPESAEAHNNLGQALAIGGDFGGAILSYEAALSLEPGLIGASYNLGVALERVGRVAEALAQYRLAVEVDPSDEEARAAVGRLEGVGFRHEMALPFRWAFRTARSESAARFLEREVRVTLTATPLGGGAVCP
jgi:tetratricopeptide (TPR) repeat protein